MYNHFATETVTRGQPMPESEPAEPIVPITVRFPESVADKARLLAKQDRRSLNSEIVYLVNLAAELRFHRSSLDDVGGDFPEPPATD